MRHATTEQHALETLFAEFRLLADGMNMPLDERIAITGLGTGGFFALTERSLTAPPRQLRACERRLRYSLTLLRRMRENEAGQRNH